MVPTLDVIILSAVLNVIATLASMVMALRVTILMSAISIFVIPMPSAIIPPEVITAHARKVSLVMANTVLT